MVKNRGITTDLYIWSLLRIVLGVIFLWSFLDKLFGLQFTTKPENAWLFGVSPTYGFLSAATKGPFSEIYKSLAGAALVDWLFMIGLLLIGLALILGIGIKIAGYSGALLMFLMYLVILPPEHNPIFDEHIIYALVLIGLTYVKSGYILGFGEYWSNTKLVKQYRFLE